MGEEKAARRGLLPAFSPRKSRHERTPSMMTEATTQSNTSKRSWRLPRLRKSPAKQLTPILVEEVPPVPSLQMTSTDMSRSTSSTVDVRTTPLPALPHKPAPTSAPLTPKITDLIHAQASSDMHSHASSDILQPPAPAFLRGVRRPTGNSISSLELGYETPDRTSFGSGSSVFSGYLPSTASLELQTPSLERKNDVKAGSIASTSVVSVTTQEPTLRNKSSTASLGAAIRSIGRRLFDRKVEPSAEQQREKGFVKTKPLLLSATPSRSVSPVPRAAPFVPLSLGTSDLDPFRSVSPLESMFQSDVSRARPSARSPSPSPRSHGLLHAVQSNSSTGESALLSSSRIPSRAESSDSEDDYGSDATSSVAAASVQNTIGVRKEGKAARSGAIVRAALEEVQPITISPFLGARTTGLSTPGRKALYACTVLKLHPSLSKTTTTDLLSPRSVNYALEASIHPSTTSYARSLRILIARTRITRRLKYDLLSEVQEKETAWFVEKYVQEYISPKDVTLRLLQRGQGNGQSSAEATACPPLQGGSSSGMAPWMGRYPFHKRVKSLKWDNESDLLVESNIVGATELTFSQRCIVLATQSPGTAYAFSHSGSRGRALYNRDQSRIGTNLTSTSQASQYGRERGDVEAIRGKQRRTASEQEDRGKRAEPKSIGESNTQFANVVVGHHRTHPVNDDDVPLALLPSLRARKTSAPTKSSVEQQSTEQKQSRVTSAGQQELLKKQVARQRQAKLQELEMNKKLLAEARERSRRTEHPEVLKSVTYGAGDAALFAERDSGSPSRQSVSPQTPPSFHRRKTEILESPARSDQSSKTRWSTLSASKDSPLSVTLPRSTKHSPSPTMLQRTVKDAAEQSDSGYSSECVTPTAMMTLQPQPQHAQFPMPLMQVPMTMTPVHIGTSGQLGWAPVPFMHPWQSWQPQAFPASPFAPYPPVPPSMISNASNAPVTATARSAIELSSREQHSAGVSFGRGRPRRSVLPYSASSQHRMSSPPLNQGPRSPLAQQMHLPSHN